MSKEDNPHWQFYNRFDNPDGSAVVYFQKSNPPAHIGYLRKAQDVACATGRELREIRMNERVHDAMLSWGCKFGGQFTVGRPDGAQAELYFNGVPCISDRSVPEDRSYVYVKE